MKNQLGREEFEAPDRGNRCRLVRGRRGDGVTGQTMNSSLLVTVANTHQTDSIKSAFAGILRGRTPERYNGRILGQKVEV